MTRDRLEQTAGHAGDKLPDDLDEDLEVAQDQTVAQDQADRADDVVRAVLDEHELVAGVTIDHFQLRVLQDAMSRGTASYWRRRAETFEQARPRPGDHLGTAGQARATEIDRGLVEARDACLNRARLADKTTAAEIY